MMWGRGHLPPNYQHYKQEQFIKRFRPSQNLDAVANLDTLRQILTQKQANTPSWNREVAHLRQKQQEKDLGADHLFHQLPASQKQIEIYLLSGGDIQEVSEKFITHYSTASTLEKKLAHLTTLALAIQTEESLVNEAATTEKIETARRQILEGITLDEQEIQTLLEEFFFLTPETKQELQLLYSLSQKEKNPLVTTFIEKYFPSLG